MVDQKHYFLIGCVTLYPMWRERLETIDPEHLARYEFAKTIPAERILDVACGIGYGTAMLGAIGTDISPDSCKQAVSKYRATTFCSSVYQLPLKSESFDLIVSFETIEHVSDTQAMLRELFRVCKPSGTLVISTPNSNVYPPGNPYHVVEFSKSEIAKAITAAGFSIESWKGQTFKNYALLQLRRSIVRAFPIVRRLKRESVSGTPNGRIESLPSWPLAPTYFIIIARKS